VTERKRLPVKLTQERPRDYFGWLRRLGVRTISFFLFAHIVAFLGCPAASADIGVVLLESIDIDSSRITGAGHSAIYLSNICPATPVTLRVCGPGEQGSIISNYSNFKEDQDFEWNIIPLEVFMYGVTDPRNRPIFATRKVKAALEEAYREESLKEICAGQPCTTNKSANWRYAVGATFERSIYVFAVRTTMQQDLDLIKDFNSRPNKDHFNGFTRNCADFTHKVINTYFPRATRPDYIDDFGITSPKAIARSFAHYGARHAGDDYHVLHFSQLPGTIKRSDKNREGTEELFHAKKWVIPLAFLASHELLPAAISSYILFGRFNPQKELEKHPTPYATELENEIKLAKLEKDGVLVGQLETENKRERDDVLGDSTAWAQYREKYDAVVRQAVSDAIIPDAGSIHHVFKYLNRTGTPRVDQDGAIWMEVHENDRTRTIGLSAANIFAANSDSTLAYELMLARINRVLTSPAHSRETLVEFKDDWALLQQAQKRNSSLALLAGQK
jgi:hypothetical protein